MKQACRKFGKSESVQTNRSLIGTGWADIIVADPIRYQGLPFKLALMALHRAGKPHQRADCPTCKRTESEAAA